MPPFARKEDAVLSLDKVSEPDSLIKVPPLVSRNAVDAPELSLTAPIETIIKNLLDALLGVSVVISNSSVSPSPTIT